MKYELEKPRYFRRKLIGNYLFKGPVLEWNTRIRLFRERDFELIHNNVPREASITDIGCGYGLISYLLCFTSVKRKILGIDHDSEKIQLARNCISKNDRINFVAADPVTYSYERSDVFLLNDIMNFTTKDNLIRVTDQLSGSFESRWNHSYLQRVQKAIHFFRKSN